MVDYFETCLSVVVNGRDPAGVIESKLVAEESRDLDHSVWSDSHVYPRSTKNRCVLDVGGAAFCKCFVEALFTFLCEAHPSGYAFDFRTCPSRLIVPCLSAYAPAGH